MKVRVLFFGLLRDLAGRNAEVLELPTGATAGDLLDHYASQIPCLQALLPSIALSVNQEYAAPDAPLNANDEIALLPPVSGGKPRVAIVRTKIDAEQIAASLKQAQDGALVVFEGVVRDNSRGRKTLYLDYQAYEAMALKQLETLAAQAIEQFKVRDVAIAHRLGRLEIGETSVLIVVSSAHRSPAFDACRWLIDTLKRTVPIWKKEYFEDGAVWADGEPLPAEIPRVEGTHSGKSTI